MDIVRNNPCMITDLLQYTLVVIAQGLSQFNVLCDRIATQVGVYLYLP